jgi:hypothetical protein
LRGAPGKWTIGIDRLVEIVDDGPRSPDMALTLAA